MKYDLPTIGGMFGAADHQRFLRNFDVTNFDDLFPPHIRDRQRCFYETGIDALAAILNECRDDDRPIHFWTAENFCAESLQRLQIKLRNRIRFHKYRHPRDAQQLSAEDILLYLHFNWFDPESSLFIERIRGETGAVVIEDFVQAPLDISRFTGDFAFNSLRKFSSLDLAVCYQSTPFSVSTKETKYWNIRKEAEAARSRFLSDPSEDLEQQFLKLCRESESALAVPEISAAHALEIERGRAFDFQAAQRLRRVNYARLAERICQDSTAVAILPGDYMYLILETEHRDRLRSELFARRIFPVIHWADSNSEWARSLLSFHIDQRYSPADMDRVFTAIKEVHARLQSM